MGKLLERETALTALRALQAAARRGRGSVALVTGEQGIGKTALLHHFTSGLDDGTRVLWGACDDLSTPRPLGPFRDIAATTSAELRSAVASGQAPHRFHTLLWEELTGQPTAVVIEDVHWADDATLDAIIVIGRRISDLPALLLLSFRGEDLAPNHPLHATLDAIGRTTTLHLRLPPLSRAAVADLAGAAPADVEPDRIYALTGGNPFYVTEMIAAFAQPLPYRSPGEPPPSVTTSVLGRCSRLSPHARDLVELASVVPTRIGTDVLDEVMPDWAVAAEEPERLGLVMVETDHLRFRHELTRAVIRQNLPAARQRRLHEKILAALLDIEGDPADIVHHGEGAGCDDIVSTYAVLAARQAAALESHREARTHFRRAVESADRLPASERAALFEAYAHSAYQVGQIPEAFTATERAADLYRTSGQATALGRCLTRQSHYHWITGATDSAWEQARAAVKSMQVDTAPADLAEAYIQLSDLAMFAGRPGEALGYSDEAFRVAQQAGSESLQCRSRVNTGVVHMQRDVDDAAPLHAAIDDARAASAHDAVVFGLIGLTITNLCWVRPEQAARAARHGVEYAEWVQRDLLRDYLQVNQAWLQLRAGAWDEAARTVTRLRDRRPTAGTVTGLKADTVLAELAIRRGDPDAPARLHAVAAEADRVGELYRLGPVLELEIEWALTRGKPLPLARFHRVLDTAGPEGAGASFGGALTTAWGALLGVPAATAAKLPAPYAAMARRDWQEAAREFEAVGWHYDQALMLSLCEDRNALETAVGIARSLDAAPLVRHVANRMRALGLPMPRGLARTTRANPSGLTMRELEVLGLLAEGMTDAEVATRLSISPRTAQHHVSRILTKLEVTTRREAARKAAELGVSAT